MLNTILRRVISEGDNMGEGEGGGDDNDPMQQDDEVEEQQPRPTAAGAADEPLSPGLNYVEQYNDNNYVPMDTANTEDTINNMNSLPSGDFPVVIEGAVPVSFSGSGMMMGSAGGVYHSGSSLSADSDDDDERLVNLSPTRPTATAAPTPPLAPNTPPTHLRTTAMAATASSQQQHYHSGTLPRMNSRGSSSSFSHGRAGATNSSQTSSRDWGWFEDVHLSETNIKKKRGGGNNGGSSGNGGKNEKQGGGGDLEKDNDKSKTTISNAAAAAAAAASSVGEGSDLAAMAVTAPTYVLEESLSSQKLWKHSAGQRPPQPVEERAFYEKMWAQNFARSQVDYKMPVEVLTAASPISLDPFADGNFDAIGSADSGVQAVVAPANAGGANHVAEAALMHRMHIEQARDGYHDMIAAGKKQVQDPAGEGNLTILFRGDNVFGTTVSKSFARTNENGVPIAGVDTINISIASYRVVESKKRGKYAQFLVIYREGSIRDTVGIWKRYSHFEELAHKVTQAHEGCAAAFANISPLSIAEEPETEHLPNAITSWRLLKKRQRWYRCLDAGYLSLKVFLLERFLHDILFESSSPELLRDFVGVEI